MECPELISPLLQKVKDNSFDTFTDMRYLHICK